MTEGTRSFLTLELERLSLRAVRRVYEDLNMGLFKERLRVPVFELSDTEGRLGRWSAPTAGSSFAGRCSRTTAGGCSWRS